MSGKTEYPTSTDDGDTVTITADLTQATHKQLRQAFNLSFLPLNELLNAIADNADDDTMEAAVQTCLDARMAVASILSDVHTAESMGEDSEDVFTVIDGNPVGKIYNPDPREHSNGHEAVMVGYDLSTATATVSAEFGVHRAVAQVPFHKLHQLVNDCITQDFVEAGDVD